MLPLLLYLSSAVILVVVGLVVFLRWGTRWGSTPEERDLQMPGDAFLTAGRTPRVVMTRAISIDAAPEIVWPWVAQLGRGAGWYSVDRLDNGGKTSARHLVSWIPPPQLGDATAIGYLRHLEPGRSLVWWLDGGLFLGAKTRAVADLRLTAQDRRSRLVIRWSADAAGPSARIALLIFRFIDSIMSLRQLLGIRQRVEHYGSRVANPDLPETGARDQYQLYEVRYASGESAGVPGRELAADWHLEAVADGVLPPDMMSPKGEGDPS